jgi:hypothetical protein
MDVGEHETLTEVMVGDTGGVLPPPPLPPQPATHKEPNNEKASAVFRPIHTLLQIEVSWGSLVGD